MSDTIAIIPARAGSKGVSDKNIRSLAGKPLIAYSIQAAVLAENIDRVIVSTDSENYAVIAKIMEQKCLSLGLRRYQRTLLPTTNL